MAKKNSVSTILIVVVFLFSLFTVFYTNLKNDKTVAYINDDWVSWDNINMISIYSDGYYGREMDQPIIIEDRDEINELVGLATDISGYEHIPQEDYLEGLCSVFIDFGNGCVISMYEETNYGTIDSEIKTVAEDEGYFVFPDEFREKVFDILKTNEPAQ